MFDIFKKNSFADNTSLITESSILKNPLDSYFGHQIFDLNIEPSELEVIANRLQVNLVYSIIVNCCPKLTCDNIINSQKICYSSWGYVILNRGLDDTVSTEFILKLLYFIHLFIFFMLKKCIDPFRKC